MRKSGDVGTDGRATEAIQKSLGRGNKIVKVKVVGGKTSGAPRRKHRRTKRIDLDRLAAGKE